MQELFEPLGFDHGVQDRFAAFLGEGNLFAVALDPLFQPARLFRVGDMHVLQSESATIGPLHDRKDLVHRRDFEAEDVVDEDRAVHVGSGEAVGGGVKLRMRFVGAHAQWVEVSNQVPPDPVGADDHQRADRVENSSAHLAFVERDALFGGLVFDLFASRFRLGGPLAVEGGGQIIGGLRRPIGARPAWACGLCLSVCRGIPQRPEERLPAFIDSAGVVGVAGVELFHVFRIVPLQEGRGMEDVVGGLVVHYPNSSGASKCS